jgi:hypothetical protein
VEDGPTVLATRPVGGPVGVAWREGTLTRAKELEALCAWVHANQAVSNGNRNGDALTEAVAQHLAAAREAATRESRLATPHNGARLERAMSNLDAAEAQILNLAGVDYLAGQLPSLVNHVQRHLKPQDPRRIELERIAAALDAVDKDKAALSSEDRAALKRKEIDVSRGMIVTAVRGASSAALREQLRVRSFRNVLLATTLVLTLLAAGTAILGWVSPRTLPLCFTPQDGSTVVIVCPTEQSTPIELAPADGPVPDVDERVEGSTSRGDLLLVEVVGLMGAAIAAAAAIRGIRGSSEPYGLPVALALLKLPTGAITAILGLLLMRGEFVPGLSALDTSAQILAWAIVFGYAQQLFTRLVDQQAHAVLDDVRGARAEPAPAPA